MGTAHSEELPAAGRTFRSTGFTPFSEVRALVGIWSLAVLLSFGLWLLILRSLPLTTAYPAAVGTTLCGTILVSVFILGENLRLSQGAGIALILVGFVLVFRGN